MLAGVLGGWTLVISILFFPLLCPANDTYVCAEQLFEQKTAVLGSVGGNNPDRFLFPPKETPESPLWKPQSSQ